MSGTLPGFPRHRSALAVALAMITSLLSACSSQARVGSESLPPAGLQYVNKTFSREFDFTALARPSQEGPSYRVYLDQPVNFVNCRFQAALTGYQQAATRTTAVTFRQGVRFEGCTFEGEVSLRNCTFQAPVDITNCVFRKNLLAENGYFWDHFSFVNNQVAGEVRLQNGYFTRKVFFLDTRCTGNFSVQGTYFGQDAQFSNATFARYADFGLCTFNGGGFFNYSTFNHTLNLSAATFRSRAEFIHCTAQTLEQAGTVFGVKPVLEGASPQFIPVNTSNHLR